MLGRGGRTIDSVLRIGAVTSAQRLGYDLLDGKAILFANPHMSGGRRAAAFFGVLCKDVYLQNHKNQRQGGKPNMTCSKYLHGTETLLLIRE